MVDAFLSIAVVAITNLVIGFVIGTKVTKHFMKFKDVEEEVTYCHGWQDGLYYALGEPTPDLFNIEVAQRCYKEYKVIKHGNVKH
jgi:hypothetical protein